MPVLEHIKDNILHYRRLFWVWGDRIWRNAPRVLKGLLFRIMLFVSILLCFYVPQWLIILGVGGNYISQNVCETTELPGLLSNLPASTPGHLAPEFASAAWALHENHQNLEFQLNYARGSSKRELYDLATVINEAFVPLDAFVPSYIHLWKKLPCVAQDLQTYHVVFRQHFKACLAVPKQEPRGVWRWLYPCPEVVSIIGGFHGPYVPKAVFTLGPFLRAHPTDRQVHNHLQGEYKRFSARANETLKALLSHPGRTKFNVSSQAIASGLQAVEADTTGKKPTLELLYKDIQANPSRANDVLKDLRWPWHITHPRRLSQQRDTFNALNRSLTNAGHFISRLDTLIYGTMTDLSELDRRFDDITTEDLLQGYGAPATGRFEGTLMADLVLPSKAGISEQMWINIRKNAERDLFLEGGEVGIEESLKEGPKADGIEGKEARKEREL